MLTDQVQERTDIFNMGRITFYLPVITCPLNHRELKPMINNPVNKMVDKLSFRGFVNRFPNFMDAVQNCFRVFALMLFEQRKCLINDIDIFFKIPIADQMAKGCVNIPQSLNMDSSKVQEYE